LAAEREKRNKNMNTNSIKRTAAMGSDAAFLAESKPERDREAIYLEEQVSLEDCGQLNIGNFFF